MDKVKQESPSHLASGCLPNHGTAHHGPALACPLPLTHATRLLSGFAHTLCEERGNGSSVGLIGLALGPINLARAQKVYKARRLICHLDNKLGGCLRLGVVSMVDLIFGQSFDYT